MLKGPLIFWTVVIRTIRVDPAKRTTAMGKVLACSNCSASRKLEIVNRRESGKLKIAEDERRKHAGDGRPEGEGQYPGRSPGKDNPG